jgi:GH15 family glucan-1,4-alpha-glucosidase
VIAPSEWDSAGGEIPVPKIQDYGIIGDCRAAALVSKFGSIDWLCWPSFDSPAVFAAILDKENGGSWSVRPREPFTTIRKYIPDSNVLQTEFHTSGGRATLTDLMPVASQQFKRDNLLPDHELMREAVCTEGKIELESYFRPRLNYGASAVRIHKVGNCGLRLDANGGAYWLRCSAPMEVERDRIVLRALLTAGERLQFSFTYGEESPAVLPALGEKTQQAIRRSAEWWQAWSAQCRYDGPFRKAVVRSALALKLLTYAPSGAIAAAATTSLPERIADSLNWDYRYCWLRDSSLAVRAMLGMGYIAEAASFITWLLHATRLTQPELRIIYTMFGRIAPAERELRHLPGYFDSRPVRVGNDARSQSQLDIYGEVIDAAAQYGQLVGRFDRTTQKVLIGLGQYVAKHWDQPDEGIWEPRTGRQNHTYSRLMCWTALDRLLALGEKGTLDRVPKEWFREERDKIREQIQTRAWNAEVGSYVQALDDDKLDAVLLRIPWYGFEAAHSERMKRTYAQIQSKLSAGDSLLYRYELQPGEGAFGICGFWAVEHLALGGGTLDEAHQHFEALLRSSNELGLYSEEIDPKTRDALGNFPQALTHIGLISAALTLEEQKRGRPHPAMHTGEDVRSAGKVAA